MPAGELAIFPIASVERVATFSLLHTRKRHIVMSLFKDKGKEINKK